MITLRSALLIFGGAFCATLAEPTIYLQETFDDGDNWQSRWVQSKHSDDYGTWKVSHGQIFADENDKGLQTSQDAKFYTISRKLEKPISNRDKPLVIAYTVKFEQDIDCGGAYMKLMDDLTDMEDFNNETPYKIMFGPDICGPEKRVVHAILHYKKKNYERTAPEVIAMADTFTHVYKMIIFPNNTYEIYVNNDVEGSGYLEDDWDMVPSRKIADESATKPDDWDDRPMIPDPNATKPDDWDQPETIRDQNSTKPDDWDDDMDGEWEPPTIPNPDFKGEWSAPTIPNPKYNGTWQRPMIDNPEYVAVPDLHDYSGIDKIGFDLWQMKSGTIIDNILITDDPDYANEFMNKTLSALKPVEKVESDKKDQELYQSIVGRMGGQAPGAAPVDGEEDNLEEQEEEEESEPDGDSGKNIKEEL